MAKNKFTKETIPQDFTVGLALVDMLPVLFFGLASLILYMMTNNIIVIIGGAIAFISGLIKVIWKIIVALKKKNIWWMFVQMRAGMPVGMTLVIVGIVVFCCTNDATPVFSPLLNPASIIFLIISVLGMVGMIVFSIVLDSADKRSNWIEQGCNSLSQLSLFLALLIAFLM